MFYVLCPDIFDRSAVIARMRADGVHPTFHYVPLHSSPAGQEFASKHPELRSPTTSPVVC